MEKMETSVKKIINALDYFNKNDKNYNVSFLSPENKLLTLGAIDIDNPDMYILVEFVNAENESPMTLNNLISKFSDLGDDYRNTFIDFLEPHNKSIVIQSDSISVTAENEILIKFSQF